MPDREPEPAPDAGVAPDADAPEPVPVVHVETYRGLDDHIHLIAENVPDETFRALERALVETLLDHVALKLDDETEAVVTDE